MTRALLIVGYDCLWYVFSHVPGLKSFHTLVRMHNRSHLQGRRDSIEPKARELRFHHPQL